jgi:hypothetical protein
MTEEQLDCVAEMKDRVSAELRSLAGTMLATEEQAADELVRLQLTETFRFWRGK